MALLPKAPDMPVAATATPGLPIQDIRQQPAPVAPGAGVVPGQQPSRFVQRGQAYGDRIGGAFIRMANEAQQRAFLAALQGRIQRRTADGRPVHIAQSIYDRLYAHLNPAGQETPPAPGQPQPTPEPVVEPPVSVPVPPPGPPGTVWAPETPLPVQQPNGKGMLPQAPPPMRGIDQIRQRPAVAA